MRRYAQVLFESIVGRTDAYAIQQSDGHYVAIMSPNSDRIRTKEEPKRRPHIGRMEDLIETKCWPLTVREIGH